MPGNMKIQMVEQHERSEYETPPHFSFAAAAFFFYLFWCLSRWCACLVWCVLSRVSLSLCACAFSNLVCWLCACERVDFFIYQHTEWLSVSLIFSLSFLLLRLAFDLLTWACTLARSLALLRGSRAKMTTTTMVIVSYPCRFAVCAAQCCSCALRPVSLFEPLRSFVFVRVQHFVCCCCSITCFVRLISLEPEAFERGSRALVVALWLWHTHTERHAHSHV